MVARKAHNLEVVGSTPTPATNFKLITMANMSYCRFENTTRDIEDCLNAIEYNEVSASDLSDYEANALKDFVSLAKEIVSFEDQINDILTEYNEEYGN